MQVDYRFPTHDYAIRVVMGDIVACSEIIQACNRHLEDLKREDIWFDQEAADKFFRYCRRFKHYKGPKKKQEVELDDWQKWVFGCIYGWKMCTKVDVSTHEEPNKFEYHKTDIWRFTSVYVEVAKKNGKSTACGAVVSYDAFVMEDSGAEVYCLATKEDQAKIVWNDSWQFICSSDFARNFFKRGNTIYVEGTNKSSFIKPLGRDSKSNDGLNPFSAVVDELHAHPNREILDIIEDGFVGRDNYHLIIITTSGNNKNGVCYQERTHGKQILDKKIPGDRKFVAIYAIDEEDRDDIMDTEKNWLKANPGLGSIKPLESMRSIVEKGKYLPSKRNTVFTKQFNVWTSVAEMWIRPEFWIKCKGKLAIEDLKGLNCYGGMDLARVHDLSANAYLFPPQKTLEKYALFVDFFIPEENIMERVRGDRVPYDIWKEQGHLICTPGNTTDFPYIREFIILRRASMFNILGYGFDRAFGGDIVSGLQDESLKMVEHGMGYLSMADPSSEFERLIMAEEIEYIENPVLEWCVENTAISKDPAGNIKPNKEKSRERIDGTVASIIALGAKMILEKGKDKSSPYEKRGLRFLS